MALNTENLAHGQVIPTVLPTANLKFPSFEWHAKFDVHRSFMGRYSQTWVIRFSGDREEKTYNSVLRITQNRITDGPYTLAWRPNSFFSRFSGFLSYLSLKDNREKVFSQSNINF